MKKQIERPLWDDVRSHLYFQLKQQTEWQLWITLVGKLVADLGWNIKVQIERDLKENK